MLVVMSCFVLHTAACDPGYAPICDDGTCVIEDALCDGFFECPDYTDELFCPRKLFNKSNIIFDYFSNISELSLCISLIISVSAYNNHAGQLLFCAITILRLYNIHLDKTSKLWRDIDHRCD